MKDIKKLIEEGKELRGTFKKTYDLAPGNYTTDNLNVAKWITESMRKVEEQEIKKKNSPLYDKFACQINRIGSLRLCEFEELIGVLIGLVSVEKNNEDYDNSNPEDPLVFY